MSKLGRKILDEILDDVLIRKQYLGKLHFGLYDGDTITLNLESWIVKLYVHECIHHLRPDWTEEQVEAAEDTWLNKLTKQEIQEIAAYILSL